MRVSRVTSYNTWNWASFNDRDHLGDPRRSLRERLATDAAHRGIDLPNGRIFLLTHLRYLGYGFNPISFFYCLDAAERLQLVLAEVNNTFGGSHTYWLRADPASRTFRSAAAKSLYVSPFMPVELDYAFGIWMVRDSEALVATNSLRKFARPQIRRQPSSPPNRQETGSTRINWRSPIC